MKIRKNAPDQKEGQFSMPFSSLDDSFKEAKTIAEKLLTQRKSELNISYTLSSATEEP